MRARWPGFRTPFAVHPRAGLAVFAVVLVTLVVGAAFIATRPSAPATADLPTQTSTQRWTLVEATQHIDAGAVSAITLGRSSAGSQVLLAQTRDGEYVALSAPSSVADGAQTLVN